MVEWRAHLHEVTISSREILCPVQVIGGSDLLTWMRLPGKNAQSTSADSRQGIEKNRPINRQDTLL